MGAPKKFRLSLIYVLVAILAALSLNQVFGPEQKKVSYDHFLWHVRQGHVEWIVLGADHHHGVMDIPSGAPLPPGSNAREETEAGKDEVSGGKQNLRPPFHDEHAPKPGEETRFIVSAVRGTEELRFLTNLLEENKVRFESNTNGSVWPTVILYMIPVVAIVFFWFLMMRQTGQMGRTALSFGRSRAKLQGDIQNVNFDDVAGCDEAKEELQEVVDFLKSPQKYQTLGGRMPKGVLLVGPPGTGKTLLARAVAGESRVPFFTLSGSDFVEMFVGVGAARVRDLFQQAKTKAPCIVFVDELDAVGRHRGAGLGGGHDEREQTLNQLLVEMDGFDSTQGVIFLAATNRPDVLDPALLRPGRFDRQVVIDAPDAKGRKAILEVHAPGKRFKGDVDFEHLAASTPGFTGADLANAINEAALLAARRGKDTIEQSELNEAVERVIAGPERKSRRLGPEERKRVAYHEAGHALVAALTEHSDPVRKISIIPRGHAALGYTMQTPEGDRYLTTRSALLDQLKSLLAGRAAEVLVFDEQSTGAANDLDRATRVARAMVCRFGMSDKMGPVTFGREQHQVFLGRDFAQEDRNYSERSAQEIDHEVRRFLDDQSDVAMKILQEHRACLDKIAETLLEREVIQEAELKKLLKGELGEDYRDFGDGEESPEAAEGLPTEASR